MDQVTDEVVNDRSLKTQLVPKFMRVEEDKLPQIIWKYIVRNTIYLSDGSWKKWQACPLRSATK